MSQEEKHLANDRMHDDKRDGCRKTCCSFFLKRKTRGAMPTAKIRGRSPKTMLPMAAMVLSTGMFLHQGAM